MATHTVKEIIDYRIEKSNEILREVDFLLNNNFANVTVSRMYYACYHSISALLFSHGIETKTHKGLRHQFGRHFVQTGIIPIHVARAFTEIADRRHESDYDDFMNFTIERVKEIYPSIIQLVSIVQSLINYNNRSEQQIQP